MQIASASELYHNKALPIGSLLREWRLESVLGVGGFGIVYRARGVYFNETVAIKEYFPGSISDRVGGTTVAPTHSSSQQVYALGLEKFLEEAKLLWALSQPKRHPNIVSVRSLFEMHGTAYSVMDLEEGRPLAEVLSEGYRFDEAALLRLLSPLAEGLSRAHEAGVIHRDIKPANILIHDDGSPVLIDFGSARLESGEATSTSVTFYTPPYAALEQYVRSYPQGPWTDVYALGVVLFQCVTGRKPPEVLERLDGSNKVSLCDGHWPGFSRSFCRAVDAAMAVHPTDRPQSMAEWLALFHHQGPRQNEALTRIQTYLELEVAEIGQPPPPPVGGGTQQRGSFGAAFVRKPRFVAGSGLALALASLVTAVFLGRQSPPRAAHFPSTPPITRPAGAHDQPPSVFAEAVAAGLDQLSAETAKVASPPQFESALSAARKSVQAQVGEVLALDHHASSEVRRTQLLSQVRREVVSLVQLEVDALLSDAQRHSDQAEVVPGPGGGTNVSAAYISLRQFGLSLKAQSQALPPQDLLTEGRQLLVGYGAFERTYLDAAMQSLPARRRVFESIVFHAKELARWTISSGNVSKPWFFASQARKTAYQRLEAAAGTARSLQAQLGRMAHRGAAAESLAELSQDIYKVSAIDHELAVVRTQASRARAALS